MNALRLPVWLAGLGILLIGCEATSPTADGVAQVSLADLDGFGEAEVTIRDGDATVARVDARVASTSSQRRQGLMGVTDLPPGTGMLFVFEDDQTDGFWMKDTRIPLDIAFITADGTLGSILAMEPCTEPSDDDCPTYTPSHSYRAALEVPQGWFADAGVTEGDQVSWPEPTSVP